MTVFCLLKDFVLFFLQTIYFFYSSLYSCSFPPEHIRQSRHREESDSHTAWGKNKSEEKSILVRKTTGICLIPLSNNPECKLLILLLKYADQVIRLK